MQTYIDILQAVLFITQMTLAVSIIVLFALLGTYLLDEVKEWRAERSLELARNREDLRQLKNENTTYFTEWVGKHRLENAVKKETGRHRFVKGEPSYTKSHAYAFVAPKTPIYCDDNFFAALIKERDERTPLF